MNEAEGSSPDTGEAADALDKRRELADLQRRLEAKREAAREAEAEAAPEGEAPALPSDLHAAADRSGLGRAARDKAAAAYGEAATGKAERVPFPERPADPAPATPPRKRSKPEKRTRPKTGKRSSASPDPEPVASLAAARTCGDMLAAAWADVGGSGDPPDGFEVAAWIDSGEVPADASRAASERLAALIEAGEVFGIRSPRWGVPERSSAGAALLGIHGPWTRDGEDAGMPFDTHTGTAAPPDGFAMLCEAEATLRDGRRVWVPGAILPEEVHALWAWLDPDSRPRHPLLPLIEAARDLPRRSESFPVAVRASLPDFDRDGADMRLIDAPGQPDQLHLPGLEMADGPGSHWLLTLYALAGGPVGYGKRLPLDITAAVGALSRLKIEDRDGQWRTLVFPHRIEHEDAFEDAYGYRRQAVERWFWPDGWGRNRYARWEAIPKALESMTRRLCYLPVPDLGRVPMLFASIPGARDHPLIEFSLRVPRSGARGARFDWPIFTRLGASSASQGRGYLSAVALLARSAHAGHPITQTLPAPVLGPDGKPARGKGGAIVRSKSERIPNPHARYVPSLTDADLARLLGYPGKPHRMARARAVKAFEALADAGLIDLAREGDRWRIFGPEGG